ncbi:hypothetical protein [Photobacterium kasasachensis]|uniref:hypothetical protein n=1 Tax=Photobacterium kasasachensis TaxID=2910240 RepID=UPI003D0AF789
MTTFELVDGTRFFENEHDVVAVHPAEADAYTKWHRFPHVELIEHLTLADAIASGKPLHALHNTIKPVREDV